VIGFIFNTLEKVVIEEFGEDAWDDLLEQVESDGVYHSLGNYADEEVVKLVVAAAEKLGKEPTDILRWFGEKAIGDFHQKWPEMFSKFNHLFEFVLSLNDIIHPQVKQLYPEAQVPYFRTVKHEANELVLEYVSSRQMCHLAEGLLKGSANVFKTDISITQPQCVHEGAEHCHLSVRINE